MGWPFGETKDDVNLFEKEKESEEVVGKDERLEGAIVKLVWKRSGLEKRRLAEIWYVLSL